MRRENGQHHHGKGGSLVPFSCPVVHPHMPHLISPSVCPFPSVTFQDWASSLPLCLERLGIDAQPYNISTESETQRLHSSLRDAFYSNEDNRHALIFF